MPVRLLVSVVDAGEAAEAAAGGAHVVDAKDPSRGALGAISGAALLRILNACPNGVETSAALGELAVIPPGGRAGSRAGRSAPRALPGAPRLTYAKIGLSGLATYQSARRALLGFAGTAEEPERCRAPRLILAAYADAARACSPPPLTVPDLALEAGAAGCLLDTAVKDGPCLLDWMDEAALSRFVAACRALGLLCALAGSLKVEHLARVARLGPHLVGVRGAACEGDRVGGRVRAAKVAALARALGAA